MSREDQPAVRSRGRWALAILALVLVWAIAGIRPIPDEAFGVVDGALVPGDGWLVEGSLAIAPPLIARLHTYPRVGTELALPQAEAAQLPSSDGSRFGLRGWITVRPRVEQWSELHRAAAGRGLSGALVTAVRAAMEGFPEGAERGPLTAPLRSDIERRLADALGERGIDLRRIDLDAFDFLTVREGDTEAGFATETKLLLVGWDGGDWEIADKLLAEGRLPNLRRLLDGGVRAKLLTISPMLSPVIWTSMSTGVEPSRHGILDFVVEDPTDGSRQPVTSAQRTAPTVWEMLSRSGVSTGIVGWWASWPADPVRGYLVSDRIAYQLFGFEADPEQAQGKTWPPELYEEIRPSIVTPDSVAWEDVVPYLHGERKRESEFSAAEHENLEQFKTLLASGESYLTIATQLSERFRPRLEVVYFEGTDTSAHLFMPYRLPALPGVDPAGIESFQDIVDRYYETADRYLGELLVDKGESWTVMLVSDHGFATDATRPRSTDSRIGHGAAADWHRRFGMLVLSGANVQPGARIEEASIYDVAPTILALFGQPVPRSWPGRVLGQALNEEFLAGYPVRYRHDDPVRENALGAGLLDPAAEDLLRKLQSLGYISGAGGPAGEGLTARNNAGVALLAEGKYEEAATEFRAGLAATPGAPMLLVNLGLSLRLLGRLDEAEPLLREAVEHPTTLRMAGHQLAQMSLDAGDLEATRAVLERILEAEPDAAEIHNTMGLVHERAGDLEAAEASFRRAAELDPDAAMPRNNIGNLYRRRAQPGLAEPWYLRAIEADPYFMGAYNNLALVYQGRGELDRAIDLYGRALAKSPANAIVLNNLASLYYAQGNLEEAREMWEQSAAADPTYESPLNNLASLAIHDGRYDEAETLLREALELDDNYGDARINLALILRGRGQADAAREQLRRATDDPRSGLKAYDQWGRFELEQGNNEDAIEVFERAGRIYPPLPLWLNPLGEAYLRAGRPDDALAVWRRSLQIQPNQPRVREVVEDPPWLRGE